jgi:ABC-type dipeptide/oligopeptide/nickel transport system permease component
MLSYLVKRLLSALVTIAVVATVVFVVLRVLPGDPAYSILGDFAPASAIEALQERLGTNRPILAQYSDFVKGALRGDFGRSLTANVSVTREILRQLPYTLDLVVASTLLGIILGVPLGVASAAGRSKLTENVVRLVGLVGISIPAFYIGALLILVFGVWLQWLPIIGGGELGDAKSRLRYLVLPVLSNGLLMVTVLMRFTRASLLDLINEDFVRTAKAKGLTQMSVLYRHALRPGLIPIVTVIGTYMGVLLGASVVVEVLFSRPGLGSLVVGSLNGRDYPMVQGGILVFAVLVVAINLVVDLSYAILDPRISYS